jgi:hypothetical protein
MVVLFGRIENTRELKFWGKRLVLGKLNPKFPRKSSTMMQSQHSGGFGKLRQEVLKFEASLGYMARSCFKN